MEPRKASGLLGLLLAAWALLDSVSKRIGSAADIIKLWDNSQDVERFALSIWAMWSPGLRWWDYLFAFACVALIVFGFGLHRPIINRLAAYRGPFCSLWVGPVDWRLATPFSYSNWEGSVFVSKFWLDGTNITRKMVKIQSAIIQSNRTGLLLPLQISTPGPYVPLDQGLAIAPGNRVHLQALLYEHQRPDGREGIQSNEFFEKWGAFTFEMTYSLNGGSHKRYRRAFKIETVRAILNAAVAH